MGNHALIRYLSVSGRIGPPLSRSLSGMRLNQAGVHLHHLLFGCLDSKNIPKQFVSAYVPGSRLEYSFSDAMKDPWMDDRQMERVPCQQLGVHA